MKSVRKISHLLAITCLIGSTFAYSLQGKGNAKHDDEQPTKQAQKHAKKPAKAEAKESQRAVRPPRAAVGTTKDRPAGWDKGKKVGWGNSNVPPGQARHSQQRQQELIREQQQRVIVYRQHLDKQELLALEYATRLQQERRIAAYRYQQAYLARLQQQRNALRNSYNYNNDPYFYTPATYSYNRNGTTYQTNQYGAEQLKQAINSGYSEGFRAGQADQQDRFNSGYQNSYAYQDANYGYNGYSGDQESYNYYFRQGFGKGYQDGYNSRSQYGTVTNGKTTILGAVLSTILNLQNLR
jgi:hypothetical protein